MTRTAFVPRRHSDPGGDKRKAPLSRAFGAWLEASGQSRQAIAEARRLARKAPALVSAWATYRDVCERQHDDSCAEEARAGMTRANAMLGIDLPPGSPTVRSLIGRLPPR